MSGVRFRYDSQAPPGRRVQITSVEVFLDDGMAVEGKGGSPQAGQWAWTPIVTLPAGATLTLAIPDFMAAGKEGFDMLKGGNADTVTEVDGENGPALTALVTNYFTLARAASGILTQRDPQMRAAITHIKRWAHRAKATMRSRRIAGTLRGGTPTQQERCLPQVPSRAALPELHNPWPSGTADSSAMPSGTPAQGVLRIAPRVDGRISQASSQSAREVHEERDKFFSQGHHGCRAGDVQTVLDAMGTNANSDLRSKLDGSGLRKGVHWDIRSVESRGSLPAAAAGAEAHSTAPGHGVPRRGMLASVAAHLKGACSGVSSLLQGRRSSVSPHFLDDGFGEEAAEEAEDAAGTMSDSEWA